MGRSNDMPSIIPANNMHSANEDRDDGYKMSSSVSSAANVTIDYGSSGVGQVSSGVKEEGSYKPGTILGGSFRLERLLGRGGMGEAWKAFDQVANRQVVVKFVPKEVQNVKRAVEMVRASFQRIHSLQHQHICPVYSLSHDTEHGLFVVMKYVDGVTLDEYRRRRIEKYGGVPTNELLDILWTIAKTLDYAHAKRVIHRDIKPQNIMVSREDGIQIIDFGLAEEIRASMVEVSETVVMGVVGTRPYMAPEQWRGRFQDARTDQYAFAATAYEMLAGMPPFHSNDVAILRECVLRDRPKKISGIPDYMNDAILRGLAKKRSERFESCKDLVKAMTERPPQKKGSSTFPGVLAADPENPPQGQFIKPNQGTDISQAYRLNNNNTWRPETMMATNYSISEQPPVQQQQQQQMPIQQQQNQPQTFQLPQNIPLWIVAAVGAVLMIMFMLLISLLLFTFVVMRSEHRPNQNFHKTAAENNSPSQNHQTTANQNVVTNPIPNHNNYPPPNSAYIQPPPNPTPTPPAPATIPPN